MRLWDHVDIIKYQAGQTNRFLRLMLLLRGLGPRSVEKSLSTNELLFSRLGKLSHSGTHPRTSLPPSQKLSVPETQVIVHNFPLGPQKVEKVLLVPALLNDGQNYETENVLKVFLKPQSCYGFHF